MSMVRHIATQVCEIARVLDIHKRAILDLRIWILDFFAPANLAALAISRCSISAADFQLIRPQAGLLGRFLGLLQVGERLEEPLALFAFGEGNGDDVVPAGVENHMAGDAVPLVEVGEVVLNAEAVWSGMIDGLDHHYRAIITVSRIDVGLFAPAFLKALDEIHPGFLGAVRVEEVGDGSALGGWTGILEEGVLLQTIEAKKLRFYSGLAEGGGGETDVLGLAVEEDGIRFGCLDGFELG